MNRHHHEYGWANEPSSFAPGTVITMMTSTESRRGGGRLPAADAPENVGFFRQFVCRVGVLDQPESMIHDVVALSSFYFSP